MENSSTRLVKQDTLTNSDIPDIVPSISTQDQSSRPNFISNLDKKPSKTLSQKKRITYACIRCRRRHIKCPGGNPCEKCEKANAQCEYPEVDKKLVISKKYLQKLQEEIASLKKANANLRSIKSHNPPLDLPNNPYNTAENFASGNSLHEEVNRKKVFKPIKIGSSDDRNSIAFLISDSSASSSNFSRSSSFPSITHRGPINSNNILQSYDTIIDKNLASAGNSDKKNGSISLHDDSHISEVIPPFVELRKRLVSSNSGEKFYAGSSSMTLFGLEVESMIPNNKLPIGITTASASTTFIPCDIDSESAILPDDDEEDDNDELESKSISTSNDHNHNINVSDKSSKNKFGISNVYPKDLGAFNTIGQLSSSSTKRKRSNTNSSTILEREGNTYRIYLRRTETRTGISVKFSLPAYSYAMLLIDTFITYNDGCFYFFNEGLVKESLKKTYNNSMKRKSVPSSASSTSSTSSKTAEVAERRDSILETINFCKFLLIFAIGEMYLGTANSSDGTRLLILDSNQNNVGDSEKLHTVDGTNPRLPGSGFFQQASELFTGLFSSGAIDNVSREGGIEVILLYAFYLQVADCSAASYLYFGIALRASFVLGLHVDVEKDSITRFELEHRRRLFWTVYMFERMLSSKAGLPLSLSDDSISTELPQDFENSNPPSGCEHYIFPDADYITNCVTIVQINAVILSSLYQRAPTANILPVIVELITRLFQWKETLPHFLKPDFQKTCENFKITRLVTNIMTEYFQGINLAVRPLLFYLTTKQIKENKTSSLYLNLSKFSQTIVTLLNASFQGSINTIRSLWHLMPQNMVALFGYMDREYLFTSAATLILFNATFGVHGATKDHLDHALMIFTKMKNLGNNPAELRRAQLIKLMQTFNFNSSFEELLTKYVKNEKEHKKAKKPIKKKRMSDSCSPAKPNNMVDNTSNSKIVTSPSDVHLNSLNDIKQDSTLFGSGYNMKNDYSEINPNALPKKVINKEIRKRVNVNRFKYQQLLNQRNQLHDNGNVTNTSQDFSENENSPKLVPNVQSNFGNREDHHQNFSKNLNSVYTLGKNFGDRSIQNINQIILGNLQHQVHHPISNTRSKIGQISSAAHSKSDTFVNSQPNGSKNEEVLNSPPAPPIDMEHYLEHYQDRSDTCNFKNQDAKANNNVLESFMSGDFVQPNHTTDFISRINTYGVSSIENDLWDDITNQQSWLNDISEEFMNLMENIK